MIVPGGIVKVASFIRIKLLETKYSLFESNVKSSSTIPNNRIEFLTLTTIFCDDK